MVVNLTPSFEYWASIESFLRSTRQYTGSDCDRSSVVDQSENSWVKTTLAQRLPSTNSEPHFIQRVSSSRTISPAWSYSDAYLPLTRAWKMNSPNTGTWKKCPLLVTVSYTHLTLPTSDLV